MTIRRLAGGVVTTTLVVAALLLGAWFVFQATTGAQLITFRTGSMSPAMPQGSLGLAIPVQASEMQVGDVITVQREAKLPVTHRIVELEGTGQPRTLIMQGDANDRVDLMPYEVTEGLRIVWAVPYAGSAITVVQYPLGRGLMLLAVGVLVVWAFWPSKDRHSDTAKIERIRGRHREEV